MFEAEKIRPSNSAPGIVSRKASSHGVCTSRNSSTPTAIEPAISAPRHDDRFGAAIVTNENTIVPHSTEPPYFTTEAGSPTSGP
jgi:hypothetical protein